MVEAELQTEGQNPLYVEMGTQTIVPTYKYEFLKSVDWQYSLLFSHLSKLAHADQLLIIDQEVQQRLLEEADCENEENDLQLAADPAEARKLQ